MAANAWNCFSCYVYICINNYWQYYYHLIFNRYNQLKQRFQPIANTISGQIPSLQPHPPLPDGTTLIHALNHFNNGVEKVFFTNNTSANFFVLVNTETKHSSYPDNICSNSLEESTRDTRNQQGLSLNTPPNTGLDNAVSVVYHKKDPHPPRGQSSQPSSAAIESQRLLHLVNSFQQHLLLMHQKNSSLLLNLVQPKLDSQNLQIVVFK